jgi:putative peptide zinc metalloprotease protein
MEGSSGCNVQVPLNATLTLRKDVSIVPQHLGQEPCYVVEDLLRSKFYRIGVREFTFISLLNGKTSLGDALGLAATTLGPEALSEQDALAIGGWLIDSQLANHGSAAGSTCAAGAAARPSRLLTILRDPLFIKLPLFNPDPLLAKLLPWCGWLLGPWFFGLWIVLCAVGLYLALADMNRLLNSSYVILDRSNWFRLTVAWFCLSLWHEMFHAVACKKHGGSVPRAGLALLFFVPAAFVDLTSSWRFHSRRHRMITAAAGIYAELFVAAVAVIVWANTPEGLLHRFCYDLAFMASLTTLFVNGNPLLRFDGY